MFLARRISRNLFAYAKPQVQESKTIVDPYFYQNTDFFSRIQNYFLNRSVLNDVERSFKDFKRNKAPGNCLTTYNTLVNRINKEKINDLEDFMAPSLCKRFRKSIKTGEDLPYYMEVATNCKIVQARFYVQNLSGVKATNKWFQLTYQFQLKNGEKVYHILERNDKNKNFKFIKFYL